MPAFSSVGGDVGAGPHIPADQLIVFSKPPSQAPAIKLFHL